MGLFEILLAVIMAGLLLYFCLPDEGFKSRRKRKQGIARITKILDKAVSRSCPQASSPDLQDPLVPLSPLSHRQREPVWHHERIGAFYRKYVAPHGKVLEHAGHQGSIRALLDLLDRYGDCPSVVKVDGDTEYQQIRNSYDLLSQISLLDHSLNVAEQMVQAVLKARDPELLTGKIMVAALGHDIGKIPQLIDSQKYSKGDHPYLSYLVLKRAILTESPLQQEEILKAVREHHYLVMEGFTRDLRKADQAAREMETEMLASEGKDVSDLISIFRARNEAGAGAENIGKTHSKPPQMIDLEWLDLKKFLRLIEPEINVEEEGRFQAFSMQNGLVYLTLDLVSKTVIRLAEKNNHPGILVNADTREKKRQIEYTVKTLLDKEGFIPSFIGKGFSGARFVLINKKAKKKTIGIYMPVDARAFGNSLTELESRKKNAPIIRNICEVRPMIGKKK